MLWLKDGIVKQHQSLYFLLLFLRLSLALQFYTISACCQSCDSQYFCVDVFFSVNWETTMFAISKKAYSHFSWWQLIIEFVAAIDAVYLSSRDRIYGPLLGSNVKSSEWTLIDYDIFFINIIIFAHPSPFGFVVVLIRIAISVGVMVIDFLRLESNELRVSL